jgi:hypothetical protein
MPTSYPTSLWSLFVEGWGGGLGMAALLVL